jgi:hypothetical protein
MCRKKARLLSAGLPTSQIGLFNSAQQVCGVVIGMEITIDIFANAVGLRGKEDHVT